MRSNEVDDPCLLVELGRFRDQVVEEDGWALNVTYLIERSWVAVPLYVGEYITSESAERMMVALGRIGVSRCYAVYAESTKHYTFAIDVTLEGLDSFNEIAAGLCYLLVGKNLEFTILFVPEHYAIVAGPKDFVESLSGKSIEDTRKEFLNWIMPWPDELSDVRSLLLEVSQRYSGINGASSN